jgi:hypothetical protein
MEATKLNAKNIKQGFFISVAFLSRFEMQFKGMNKLQEIKLVNY